VEVVLACTDTARSRTSDSEEHKHQRLIGPNNRGEKPSDSTQQSSFTSSLQEDSGRLGYDAVLAVCDPDVHKNRSGFEKTETLTQGHSSTSHKT